MGDRANVYIREDAERGVYLYTLSKQLAGALVACYRLTVDAPSVGRRALFDAVNDAFVDACLRERDEVPVIALLQRAATNIEHEAGYGHGV